MEAILQQESAGREDLDVEDVVFVVLALHLAEVGRLAGAEKFLQQLLLFGTPDLHLKIPATGRPAGIVGGPAGGRGAGIGVGDDRVEGELASPRRRSHGELSCHQASLVDHPESVTTEPPRLGLPAQLGDLTPEAVGLAADPSAAAIVEMAAGDMQARLDPELLVLGEHSPEVDPLDMAEEPGCVVVLLPFEDGDPEDDVEGATLAAESAAGRSGHGLSGDGERGGSGRKVAATGGGVIPRGVAGAGGGGAGS